MDDDWCEAAHLGRIGPRHQRPSEGQSGVNAERIHDDDEAGDASQNGDDDLRNLRHLGEEVPEAHGREADDDYGPDAHLVFSTMALTVA